MTNAIARLSARGFLRRDVDPGEPAPSPVTWRTLGDTPDAGFLADSQRSAEQMWNCDSDAQLLVILDFLTGTTVRIRNRIESIEANEP
ncbi:hypothetical protein [Mycolicibacterium fortuitum]|uniref:hypothetical protein n=1 Tax=Mycolicibacterium fortuitum TaxID=1766 RepID=UPI00263056B0|nr:hypothetical protein [Mycolicibacterium fortuitum]